MPTSSALHVRGPHVLELPSKRIGLIASGSVAYRHEHSDRFDSWTLVSHSLRCNGWPCPDMYVCDGIGKAEYMTGRPADQQRFDALYRAHSEAILNYLLRRAPNSDDAVDATADVFTVAWRRLNAVPDGDAARLWLFGVARNTLQNERRRHRRRSALIDRLKAEISAAPPLDEATAASACTVVAGLATLSEDDRELLMLTGWDALTPAEAAVVLDVPAATVRVRLHRARTRLRAALDTEASQSCVQRSTTVGQVQGRGANGAPPGTGRN